MALPTIAGVVRCTASGNVPSGQRWANVLHCRYAGGASSPGVPDINNLHALLQRLWFGAFFGSGRAWMTHCTSQVTFAQIAYLPLDTTSLATVIAVGQLGTATGNSAPSECAPVLTLRSSQRGRSHRGRIYMPTPAMSSIGSDGRLLSSTTSEFLLQVTGLQTALGGVTVAPFWEIGIASYKLGTFSALVNPTMDLDIDVQRRRKN